MRLSRYFCVLFIITCLGLLYTHQHFTLTRANYNIIKYQTQLSQLLDRNKKLMYNVTTLESPANLEEKLDANGINYDMPRRWAVVRRLKSEHAYEVAKAAERRNVAFERILNFMTVKASAQPLEN